MQMWIVPIIVAVITGPLVVLMSRFDRRNTEQHDRNMKELERIGDKIESVGEAVDKLDGRLDGHIEWHLDHRGENGRRTSA